MPHPDDEFEAWSLVGKSPDHYTVFILLTQGERSSLCSGGGILNTETGDQTLFGERLPIPQPFTGKATPACALERVNAFHAFLDQMAGIDLTLDKPALVGRWHGEVRKGDLREPGSSRPDVIDANFNLYIGRRSARVIFNLGDGALTSAKVTWGIQTVRRLRSRFPVTAEDNIVGSAYYSARSQAYVPYSHSDHFAVQQALFLTDQGTPGAQFGPTVPDDPNRRVRRYVDSATYCAVMCVEPLPVDPANNALAQRRGIYQRVYGWLAFSAGTRPPANSYWPSSYTPTLSIFSQAQDFWHRFGDISRASTPRRQSSSGPASGTSIAVTLALLALVGLPRLRHHRHAVESKGRGSAPGGARLSESSRSRGRYRARLKQPRLRT